MVIRAIVFDAYGTLYDVQSVGSLANELCGNKGELITQLWRLKQLEYSWLHSLMRDYRDFWPLTRASLEFSLKSVGIEPDPALCERLMGKYLELDLHEDSRVALDELDDYELAILSNGSQPMLDALVASSGLGDRFAAGISVGRPHAFRRGDPRRPPARLQAGPGLLRARRARPRCRTGRSTVRLVEWLRRRWSQAFRFQRRLDRPVSAPARAADLGYRTG